MKIAVAKYTIDAPQRFDDFCEKQTRWLREAALAGARIAVMPEYLSLELAATFSSEIYGDLRTSFAAIQRYRRAWLGLFTDLSHRTGMYVVSGSFLLEESSGRYRNRADLFSPGGGHAWQDKLQLTGFEKKTGAIDGGDAVKVFDIDDLRVGIAVCYDIEFPLPVRAQREAGAQLLLVPSCTDTVAGATRVRVGCLARALENRCFVAQAVTAGEAGWSPALDTNTGEATVYAPMDVGFPADGIVASTIDSQRWAYADFDPQLLHDSRERSQVTNDLDWPGQSAPALRQAKVEICR
jgi:predicted amidohydrolase